MKRMDRKSKTSPVSFLALEKSPCCLGVSSELPLIPGYQGLKVVCCQTKLLLLRVVKSLKSGLVLSCKGIDVSQISLAVGPAAGHCAEFGLKWWWQNFILTILIVIGKGKILTHSPRIA